MDDDIFTFLPKFKLGRNLDWFLEQKKQQKNRLKKAKKLIFFANHTGTIFNCFLVFGVGDDFVEEVPLN